MPKPILPANIETRTEDQIDAHLLLASGLVTDPDTHCIRIRNSAGYMVAQIHQYSNGCGPVRGDADIYARLFANAPGILAALKECALQIAQTRNRSLTASEQSALDNARTVITAVEGAA
ncbi:hypothetical protein [Tardiphaga sp.]|uniref:hypothetical protein n=1 Tax=Tardiphaga sp. TaxID=1926292 RepID=UPI002629CBC6|nr:hypothetical protein [Tardiphaga sp.]MDB5618544.1 hypothetical protein [Tardiphaga sp.]